MFGGGVADFALINFSLSLGSYHNQNFYAHAANIFLDTLFSNIIHDVCIKQMWQRNFVNSSNIQVVFLSLFNVPGIGTTWLDYVLPLACLLAVPFILPVRVT